MRAVLGRRNVAVLGLALLGAMLALLMLRLGPGPSPAATTGGRASTISSSAI